MNTFCDDGLIGKRIAAQVYVHVSALEALPSEMGDIIRLACGHASLSSSDYNVVRHDKLEQTVSFLDYGDFFGSAIPQLARSWLVRLTDARTSHRTYSDLLNPPILHRKELLLAQSDNRRRPSAQLTAQLDALGFFNDPLHIGFKLQWERLLRQRGFRIIGHELVPIGNDEQSESSIDEPISTGSGIARHLTALSRQDLSAPMQLLERFGFLDGSHTVFDYGCGKGDDLRTLKEGGIQAFGWDPHYAPQELIRPADIVNLGFVINVIEDPVERRDALQRSYELASKLLAVSTMIATELAVKGAPYGDGVLTGRRTFQKYFTQAELRQYLQANLGEVPISVAPGIFLIFRDKEVEQRFLSDRYRSPAPGTHTVGPSPARGNAASTSSSSAHSKTAQAKSVRA